jgi:NADPH:quinone reductase-like Zn-dependent oxidoreductase
LCRALGARVAVTASAGKVGACRALGADVVIDYGAQDFTEVVGDVDVVLDVIGGDYLARNVAVLRVGGRIVQVGVMGGGSATFPLGALLPKRATITGTVLRARPLEEKIALAQRFTREVLPWFADGTLHPVIDSRFALDDVAAAHERLEANLTVGKIVIDISPQG